MAKLNLLRNAITSHCSFRKGDFSRGLPFLLRNSSRRFSTEAEQPRESSPEPFRQSPTTGWLVQFPSRSAFDNAFKVIGKKGRLYKLERAPSSQWDIIAPYNGKAVLLPGIPRNVLQDDIDRFLSGYDYDASSIKLITRSGLHSLHSS